MDFVDPVNSIMEGRLYLGNQYAASSREILVGLGVSHVVNAAAELPDFFPGSFAYYRCELRDSATEHADFEGPVGFIQRALAAGGVVFVHCASGVSRSASVVIAYLMKAEGLSVRESAQKVRERRPFINPNPNLVRQLTEYERKTAVMSGGSFGAGFGLGLGRTYSVSALA